MPPSTNPVTILMPVRNGASTLEVGVRDLLAGMESDDEFLIVDDGSEDITPSVIARLARDDSRVRMVSTRGLGLVEALNLGLGEATHDWVARADADDRYPVERLALQRRALGTDVALVTGDYSIVAGGQPCGMIPSALGDASVKLSLVNPQRIPHPGVVLSKSAVLACGGYRADDFPAEDLGLWERLRGQGSFLGVPGTVVSWHMHPQSISHSRQAQQRNVTHRLVSSIRSSLVPLTEDEIASELARYADSPVGVARALLLARDLASVGQFGPRSAGTRLVMAWLASRPLDALGSLGRMVREQRQRAVFRRRASGDERSGVRVVSRRDLGRVGSRSEGAKTWEDM